MSLQVKNLLVNPSFDDNPLTIDGWQLYNSSGAVTYTLSIYTRAPRWSYGLAGSEAYALELYVPSGGAVSIGNLNFVPVSTDLDFYTGCYVHGGDSNVTIYLMVKYYSSGFIHIETQYNQFTGSATLQFLDMVSVPPPSATYARFAIRIVNNSITNHYIKLDDAFMYYISQPKLRSWVQWNNTSGAFDLWPKNPIRVYVIITIPYDSGNTTTSSVYIEPATGVPAGAIAAAKVNTYPTIEYTVFNPPAYDGSRPYSGSKWRINNLRATGGTLYAVVYFNSAQGYTFDDW